MPTDPDQVAKDHLAAQRAELPDGPGVYLFRDARGKVIYVGKAKSVRKRVASHFARHPGITHREMVASVDRIDCVAVGTETEALIVEQSFIKQYRPRFNVRLRDDKSYPYIGISLDEQFPRVYFTREKHRPGRIYFGPYSNAKRVRDTLDLLQKAFLFRSCDGAEPGRRSGSPCLDYYIKRCEAPCVDYVSRNDYMRGIEGVMDFLSGRYARIEQELEGRMRAAAAAQEFEQAAVQRNRLNAVRSLLERQRMAGGVAGTFDAVALAVDGTVANAQVFQIREGALVGRESFYLENEANYPVDTAVAEFLLQYYGATAAIPPLIVLQPGTDIPEDLESELSGRRGSKVELRPAERGDKRHVVQLAERNAQLALSQEQLKSAYRSQRRVQALTGLQETLALDVLPVRIECFDISNLGGTHTTASMVVFEGGKPKKSDYRRFLIREAPAGDDFAAMEEVLTRRLSRWQQEREREQVERDASFAVLPDLVVIDGGKGQLASGLRALTPFQEYGVAVVSLAKRLEEIYLPDSSEPIRLPHDTAPLQLMQQIRDEAHRFALTHHRVRRDRALTESVLDQLPGVGQARKRLLLKALGSPDAVLSASREELEAVPGLPGKVAREIYAHIHRAG